MHPLQAVSKKIFILPFTIFGALGTKGRTLRKRNIQLAILMVMVFLGFSLVYQASSRSENLKVLNYSWYIDSIGGFHVVGEVQNAGSTILDPVVLAGTVYTPDGEAQIQSIPCVAYVKYMLPQQKAPFLMDFRSIDLSWLWQGIDRIDFEEVQANVTDKYQYPDLTVTTSALSIDAEGVYWVTGNVQNTGSKTATNVRVIATFLNASNTVVAAGYSQLLTPSSLNPLGVASFRVGAFDVNKTETTPDRQISSYTIIVQAEGPLLSGTPPSSTSYSPSNSSSPNSPPPDSSSNVDSSDSPPIDYLRLATITAIVCAPAAVLLIFRRRKAARASTEQERKSQPVLNRKKRPGKRRRDI